MSDLTDKDAAIASSAITRAALKEQLIAAIAAADVARVRALIDEGFDVNWEVNRFHYTPLMLAASKGLAPIVSLLIERGANIDARTFRSSRTTALHLAIESSHCKVVSILMQKGANYIYEDDDGLTPLQLALQKKDASCVAAILKGADILYPSEVDQVEEKLPEAIKLLSTILIDGKEAAFVPIFEGDPTVLCSVDYRYPQWVRRRTALAILKLLGDVGTDPVVDRPYSPK